MDTPEGMETETPEIEEYRDKVQSILGFDPPEHYVPKLMMLLETVWIDCRESCGDHLEKLAEHYPEDTFPEDGQTPEAIAGTALRKMLPKFADVIREGPGDENGEDDEGNGSAPDA